MTLQLKIGELARRTGCPAETIRYYEREGLLAQPFRTAGNYRVYSSTHLERLSFIRNCRSLDMTLEEIRHLLRVQDVPQAGCATAHQLLDDHISHVATRIVELRQLERQLKVLRRRCGPALMKTQCGILDDLGRATVRKGGKGPVPHVRGTHRTGDGRRPG
jgi:Cd(II)/Pb(II)-responsive transcriptional regulator